MKKINFVFVLIFSVNFLYLNCEEISSISAASQEKNEPKFSYAGNADEYDSYGYDFYGFDRKGSHIKTGTKYDGYGYDKEGYDKDGYNQSGFDKSGYDRNGFDINGFDKNSLNSETGTKYDKFGYDKYGYDIKGLNKYGEKKGNLSGSAALKTEKSNVSNSKGVEQKKESTKKSKNPKIKKENNILKETELNSQNIKKTEEAYITPAAIEAKENSTKKEQSQKNKKTYDKDGYDEEGFNKKGYDKNGYNKNGYDKNGYDKEGFNKNGRDKEGLTKEEREKRVEIFSYIEFKYTIPGGYGWKYNSVSEGRAEIDVGYSQNRIILYLDNSGTERFKFVLGKDDKEKFIEFLGKFNDWNKKAVSKRIKLNKEMGNMVLKAMYEEDGKWTETEALLRFRFFSKSSRVNQLIISIDKEKLKGNKIEELIPQDIYFGRDTVGFLIRKLSDKGIEGAIKNRALQKEDEKEFK